MLQQIAQFQRDAKILRLNGNSVEDFKLWVEATKKVAMTQEQLNEVLQLHKKWLDGWVW